MKERKFFNKLLPLKIVCFFLLLYILAPIIVLVVASFSQESYMVFPPKGLSLQWYIAFFTNKGFTSAFKTSCLLAVVTTVCSLILGTISAYGVDRSDHRDVLLSFFVSPLMIPTIITGLAMLQFYGMLNVERGFLVLLSGHVVFSVPYVVRTVAASLYRFNVTLEEAAQTLGANRVVTFMKITLPILKPALIASSCFAFITSFGNLALSIFLTTARFTTLPIRVYSYAAYSPDPTIAAISAVILVLTIVIMLIVEKTTGMDKFM